MSLKENYQGIKKGLDKFEESDKKGRLKWFKDNICFINRFYFTGKSIFKLETASTKLEDMFINIKLEKSDLIITTAHCQKRLQSVSDVKISEEYYGLIFKGGPYVIQKQKHTLRVYIEKP